MDTKYISHYQDTPTNRSWKFHYPLRWSILVYLFVVYIYNPPHGVGASLEMKRLYEDLFTDYNRLIVPVTTNRTKVTITLGLKLGQILDLNLKQQILSTNVWVEQTWYDHRLEWDPQVYGGIDMIHVPAENIWIPDIVLFNNADGNYELTLVAKAVLYSNGTVVWKPPTMFRSICEIDVEYFPFDIQTCFLRFGSWTYAGDEVEIKHVGNKRKVDIGIDLSQFYKNVEWDIIDVPAYYNENYYECCKEPFPDITFKIVIRRKMLFYLVNLILPVALMTFMTVSVFYLPADSNEKVTLSISILTSLIVFFLLMLEVIPPTSLAVPLFGKYLLFTLVLVSLSACVSVYVLNIYHRAPSVHQMSPRMRQLFLKTLPRLLRLDRPDPRERSSLNRFRKKKIAQQILQARQHNKIYDLSQPLAASLNLIDTLQKSYTINPEDDSMETKHDNLIGGGNEEEGRYFRRYVDNYMKTLKVNEASKDTIHDNGKSSMDCSQCPARVRKANHCCEHRKCCSKAKHQSIKTIRSNPLVSCNHNGNLNSNINDKVASGAYGPNLSTFGRQNQSYLEQMSSFSGRQFVGMHDDTLDMTFDYDDDQDNNNSDLPKSRQLLTPSCGKQRPIEADLPSPPPPPRQLTQLSDSMKDLSGRISGCSQQKLIHDNSMGLSRVNSKDDDRQLVDKLISSINLINDSSNDIDSSNSSTTLTNNGLNSHLNKSLLENMKLHQNQIDNHSSHMIDHKGHPLQRQQSVRCTCQGNAQVGANRCQMQYNFDTSCDLGGNDLRQRRVDRTNQMRSTLPTNLFDCSNVKTDKSSDLLLSLRLPYDQMPDHVRAAIRSILFIADTIKNEDDENSAIEDWESMSMVVDRLFLWIFFLLCTFGSIIILALAPSLYDQRDSIDDKLRIEMPASNCSALHDFT